MKKRFFIVMIVLIISLLPVINSAAQGSNTIVVRARGTGGSEQIRVEVGGTTIQTFTLTTSLSNYTASTSSSGAINVRFINDGSNKDVFVDYIDVNGERRQAENQATNTGVYQNSKCGGSNSEWMHCNGYIAFGDVGSGTTTTSAGSTTTTSSGGTTTSSGSGNITVRARGTKGGEKLEVQANGTTVATHTMSTSYANYSASGSGTIRVAFTNDDQQSSGMDIQVDYVTIDGTTYQAENQATNTGVYQNSQCGGSNSEWLHCNGYIQFNTGSTTTTSSGSTTTSSGSTTTSSGSTTTSSGSTTTTSSGSGNIIVRARGTKGGEKLEVQANGTTVATHTMSTSYTNYSASGSGTIRVAFTNDDQQSSGMDIQVDYVTIDGTTYQAENQATNTGVYQNSQCGGSNSEWLHCNGYIEFGGSGSTTTSSGGSTTTTSGGTTPEPSPTPGTGCSIPAMPSFSSLPSNSKLPDPFKFMNGSRMTSKNDWTCRRAEIAALAQEFEFGYKPDKPSVTGSYSNNSITVNCSSGGKSISFSCSISYPSSGSAPYPAMIGVGGSSLNNSQLSSLGVAVITFPNDQVAQQTDTGSRGKGKFYDLYGSSHSAGALIAWAWGVDCLIDALEKTQAARIDASRLGVTGCSRNGKGALVCGAFCDRIKLTIPQESGAGGAASWRVSQAQKDSGQNVQTLSQIVTENVWFRQNFSQFGSAVNKLPFDHHMVAALCAPRALLFIENTQMEWLGNLSCWTNGNVTHMVWEALGISDKMGFSQAGHSDHCGFPSSQQAEVTAYVQKFLVGGGTGNTNVMKTDGSLTFDKAKWVDWTVPSL